jgi:succinate dehydrogenase / fumarate reductase, cytochrome b subunit
LRRLHSLTGIVPVGCVSVRAHSDFELHRDHRSRRLRPPGKLSGESSAGFALEFFGIWLPIAVSRALRLLHLVPRRRKYDCEYPWTGNWMYTAQRWTGGIAFATSCGTPGPCALPESICTPIPNASFGKVQAEVFQTPLLLFYVVGLIAASWHFAYGIWLFSAKWGIVSGEKAQKRFLASAWRSSLSLTVRGTGQLTRSGRARSNRLTRHGQAWQSQSLDAVQR